MKLIDELYEMYRNKIMGDEEDIDILAFAVLEELDRKDLIEWVHEMSEQELFDLFGLYLIESLKGKFAREGMGTHKTTSFNQRNIH